MVSFSPFNSVKRGLQFSTFFLYETLKGHSFVEQKKKKKKKF